MVFQREMKEELVAAESIGERQELDDVRKAARAKVLASGGPRKRRESVNVLCRRGCCSDLNTPIWRQGYAYLISGSPVQPPPSARFST